MRDNRHHEVTDERIVRRLITENPWATLVSQTSAGLIASHYPVLLDEESDGLAVVSHVGRPDERIHELGEHEVLLIVAGPHGYVSPSWYGERDVRAPTWNFSVAHCYGTPDLLDADENLRVLTRLVDHFEQHVTTPVPLEPEYGAKLARGTVGIRLRVDRFICKVKMSQDKTPESRERVLTELHGSGPYADAALAADMERALSEADLK